MPGIVGLVTNKPREWAEPHLARMLNALRHEPFYVTGTWFDEALGIYVGWVARENSFSDRMPLRSEARDTVLVFSGEEFADPGTVGHLKQQGHSLDAEGPSYLVHVSEENPGFPASLNGRFHGLLANCSRGMVSLFNDRYGMHRIYYHESREAFYFAAEAKAILTVRPDLRSADPRGLGELVACGCVLENRTLFPGIHVLPPASYWVFRAGSLVEKRTYFNPRDWEDQLPLESEDFYQTLRDTFSRNLPRYFNGREPVGMSVTGGLDTRMIMAWGKCSPGSLRCYSFAGPYHNSQDVILAKQVTKAWGQSLQVIPVGDEFLSRFAHYAQRTVYLTDGCVDVSHSPDLYANERAASLAPVRLTGNYGGEVLRRVRAFKPVMPAPGLFRKEFQPHFQTASQTYSSLIGGHALSFAVFRQAPWHHYGLLALEQTQLALRSPYLDNEFVRTLFRAPKSAFESNDICLRLIADGNPVLRQIRTDRGLMGNSAGLSAAAKRAFLEFTFKAEYAYDYGMPQWVAQIDHLLSPLHLERIFLGRHKFYHFRVWYRDALSKYVKDMLLDPRTLSRPYLERQGLETMVQAHLKGNRNYTTEIHKVLTLELLHRLFIDAR